MSEPIDIPANSLNISINKSSYLKYPINYRYRTYGNYFNRSYSANERNSYINDTQIITSHSYPPSYQYKNFRSTRKLRKCAYIIAIISQEYFAEFGAQQMSEDPNIFVAKRSYVSDSHKETCAIIGINKHYVRHLFDDNSILYQRLKKCEQLQDIHGIETLRAYRLEPLKQLLKFLFFVPEKDLIIFNIEPMGKDEQARIYPTANICIPGGGMEKEDGNCYEMCGRREFEEETQIVIPKNIKYVVRQKFNLTDRQAVYFMVKMFKNRNENKIERNNIITSDDIKLEPDLIDSVSS